MSYADVNKLENPEDRYKNALTNEIEDVMLSKITTDFYEKIKEELWTAHNNSGFYSIIKNVNKEMHTHIFNKE